MDCFTVLHSVRHSVPQCGSYLRMIGGCYTKGIKKTRSCTEPFLNHIRNIRAYKFGLFHRVPLCITLCYTVEFIHDNLGVVTQKTRLYRPASVHIG